MVLWREGKILVGWRGPFRRDKAYCQPITANTLAARNSSDFKRPDPFIAKSLGHHKEWIQACKTGAPTTCSFDYSGLLTEANHLGNVAYRAGKKLDWNHEKLKATNAPEAARLIRREYRKGWSLA